MCTPPAALTTIQEGMAHPAGQTRKLRHSTAKGREVGLRGQPHLPSEIMLIAHLCSPEENSPAGGKEGAWICPVAQLYLEGSSRERNGVRRGKHSVHSWHPQAVHLLPVAPSPALAAPRLPEWVCLGSVHLAFLDASLLWAQPWAGPKIWKPRKEPDRSKPLSYSPWVWQTGGRTG